MPSAALLVICLVIYSLILSSEFSGNAVMLREKLLSITSHMCNAHEYENNSEYKRCPHDELEEPRERPWLDQDSLVNQQYGHTRSRGGTHVFTCVFNCPQVANSVHICPHVSTCVHMCPHVSTSVHKYPQEYISIHN